MDRLIAQFADALAARENTPGRRRGERPYRLD
jgi:hypothetical protein